MLYEINRYQHLKQNNCVLGIHLVKEMCHANTNGDRLNSCELSFQPKTIKMGKFNLNVNTQTAAYDFIRSKNSKFAIKLFIYL